MSIGLLLKNVFGEYPSIKKHLNHTNLPLEEHIKELNVWLDTKLADTSVSASDIGQIENGCIGPTIKILDVQVDTPSINISKDRLTVQSQSAFATVKANCCVFKGKWMYEVQLRSKGIMQIGWCSAKCKFTQDTGVGDTRNSYGLDGSKQRLWHVQTRKYGPYWRSGDIFGVCIDMETGTIEYYRNGVALGEAFKDIERGAGIALFPAFSLAFNDSVTVNFGGSPFRHPVKGYQPMECYPKKILENADFLLRHLINLARIISTQKMRKLHLGAGSSPSSSAVHLILASLLIGHLSKFLNNSYVIQDHVFSYVRSMCVIRSDSDSTDVIYPGQPQSTLGTFFTLLWTYLDQKDIKLFIRNFLNYLSSMYRETPADLEYEKQRLVIVVLTCICNHPMSRKYLLEYRFFQKNCLPIFLYIKPPDESTLGELLPDDHVWTQGLGGSKDQYDNARRKLKQCTDVLYVLQRNLVEKLMDNNDGDSMTPSSRKIFANKFRKYVVENSLEHRIIFSMQGGQNNSPTQPAVALSFLCILLDVLQQLFAEELEKSADRKCYVTPKNFYDGTFLYNNYDRVGGILVHLRKLYRKELMELLGEDHSVTSIPEVLHNNETSDFSIYSAMFLITGSAGSSAAIMRAPQQNSNGVYIDRTPETPNIAVTPGKIDSYQSVNELLDGCVMYYYAVAHKYIIMIADLRDNIGIMSEILVETKNSYDEVKKTIDSIKSDTVISSIQEDILNELNDKFDNRKNVFAQRSIELARKQAWYRSVALGSHRRKLLAWMLKSVFDTLLEASDDGVLFSFVPEVYINILPILLDTVLDFSFHDLCIQYDLSDAQEILHSAADFLGTHSADTRIVLESCKDALLQALGTLTCHEMGVKALETATEESQLALVHGLLRPYENRPWRQSNWLFIRFWLGEGFAFRDSRSPSLWQGGNQLSPQGLFRSRGKNGSHTGLLHHIAPAYPSEHFHKVIANVLLDDEPFGTIFVNSILTQLNWAFSEFILLLQEIQLNSQRQDQRMLTESRQLKICSMCFELTVSLMRSLEMLLTIAPDIFKEPDRPNSDLLLNRVCQLIGQVLSRVTVPPGCFQFVIDLCLPDLTGITHFAIITATLGILLSLLKDELNVNDKLVHVPRIMKILLTDPSFQIASLEFALGETKTPIPVPETVPKGNFDPQMRGHIDPLTNEVRICTGREFKPDQPIIQFNLIDYTSHVDDNEIKKVRNLIDVILKIQSIMSDVTLPSDDSICPICYSQSVSATFEPCQHQSCSNCIVQHLMNSKVCFYCKTLIVKVQNFDGLVIYENLTGPNTPPPSPI